MTIRCVALLSGSLDSMLAVRLMQQQRIEVDALYLPTIFRCGADRAEQAARELGVRLAVLTAEDFDLDRIKFPRFGFGQNAGPCIDCRINLFQHARRYLDQAGAHFVVSGEIIGQRPFAQRRRDLEVIAFHAGLDEQLLRPLSARLLPPTLPERSGWVDRHQLYGLRGRGRRQLIQLAREFGLPSLPAPSAGCALGEPQLAQKVHDLINFHPAAARWDFELLKWGRHFRFDAQTKVVVGRHERENQQLEKLFCLPESSASAMIFPDNFNGPRTLLVGPATTPAVQFAIGLIVRYAKHVRPGESQVRIEPSGQRQPVPDRVNTTANEANYLAAE